MLDRILGGFLGLAALGDLFGAWQFLGEIVKLHEALRDGGHSLADPDPGTTLPPVYVLGASALAFAVLFGAVAVLILRASPLGLAALRGGVLVLLPARLLAYLATYIQYDETVVAALPVGAENSEYRTLAIGQMVGGGIGVFGVTAALLVLVGAALVRWFRPGADPWETPRESLPAPSFGSSASSINAARILALAGTVVALLVPVAWVRPLGNESDLPSEWSFVALVSGFLGVGALVAAGLCVLARPGRLLFRWLALGALGVVAAVEWAMTLWQAFYADVAYGVERVDGVAVPWTAAIACGLVSAALLTVAVVVLMLPAPPSPDGAPAVTVTRRGDGVARERIGEATAEPGWQAFPAEAPAEGTSAKKAVPAKGAPAAKAPSTKKAGARRGAPRKKAAPGGTAAGDSAAGDATRTAEPGPGSR